MVGSVSVKMPECEFNSHLIAQRRNKDMMTLAQVDYFKEVVSEIQKRSARVYTNSEVTKGFVLVTFGEEEGYRFLVKFWYDPEAHQWTGMMKHNTGLQVDIKCFDNGSVGGAHLEAFKTTMVAWLGKQSIYNL